MRVCLVNDVLHVLDHSLPEQSGYAYRGHAILSELQRLGVSLDVVTGPKQGKTSGNPDKIDGILYQRTVVPEGVITSGVTGQARTIAATRKRIAESLRDGQARLIHELVVNAEIRSLARRNGDWLYHDRRLTAI